MLKTLLLSLCVALFSLPGAAQELSYVDEAQGCFQEKTYPCAVRILRGPFKVHRGGQAYVIDEGSSVLWRSESQIQLLEGEMWIERADELEVSVNPSLGLKVSGEFWLRKTSEGKLVVRNMDGNIEFKSAKTLKSETLPVGFENWYQGLGSNSQVVSGIIQPIAFEEFSTSWAKLATGPKVEKIKSLKAYREKWKEALKQSTDFYAKVVERSLASIEDKKASERKAKQRLEEERQELRKLYRQKNYLDPVEEGLFD